ncbi:MAG: response regulator [Rhodoferax sp.]
MSIRVLLVDDNKTFLAAVKNFLLTLPGVQVVGQAHDGQTAITLAAQLAPDLVLLDIVMPAMSGLEVAVALQALVAPPHIVFLSMHDSQAYRSAAHALGARGYVGKGDFVSDLVPLIESLMRELQGPGQSTFRPTGVSQ